MKVLVPIKRVIDANFRIRVRADGTGVDTAAAKMSMNPFDQIAVEQALRVKEAGGAMEIVLITIGPAAAQDVLRMGLAMGADRAILVTYEARAEPLTIAKLLAAVVELEKPSLVLMGKQAIDDDASQTGQMLAGLLDWPQATFASTLAVEDGKVAVTREVDGGSQSVRLSLPAVVTADLRLNQPRYASLPNIMKAKSKPLTMLEAQALGVDVRPRFEVIRTVEPPVRKRGKEVENVQELAGILKAQILSK